MNLSDPELELVDPTPDVHSLFLHFNQVFFWNKLTGKTCVRWSKRMYSCAGICSYNQGLCDIVLSEPLLKLRPRKDLVETLLHEMIHAFLFLTNQDRDRDGHGPNFKEHMHRINKAAGINISIYHDFHDEVELYKTHWWRCNGHCRTRKPHFGIVRRTCNKAPGPTDYWWRHHQSNCGGTFIKIKEPENFGKKKRASPNLSGDITKYINTTASDKVSKPVLKDSNSMPVKSNLITKSNSKGTLLTIKNNVVFKPQAIKSPVVSGYSKTKSVDVLETVRNVWANKQSLSPTLPDKNAMKNVVPIKNSDTVNTNKHKIDDSHILSPPSKNRKIDDYFKSTANSLLNDLYGKEFEIKETLNNCNNKRYSVVSVDTNLVHCPVCNKKMSSGDINRHLDECLNQETIKDLSNDDDSLKAVINTQNEPSTSKSNDLIEINEQECPCCGKVISTSMNGHLDECLVFFNNNTTIPQEGASSSCVDDAIVINDDDDEDIFDESLKLNATGTKYPCPCCMKMTELNDMNLHLDICLS